MSDILFLAIIRYKERCSTAQIAIARKLVFQAYFQIRCLVFKIYLKKKFSIEN